MGIHRFDRNGFRDQSQKRGICIPGRSNLGVEFQKSLQPMLSANPCPMSLGPCVSPCFACGNRSSPCLSTSCWLSVGWQHASVFQHLDPIPHPNLPIVVLDAGPNDIALQAHDGLPPSVKGSAKYGSRQQQRLLVKRVLPILRPSSCTICQAKVAIATGSTSEYRLPSVLSFYFRVGLEACLNEHRLVARLSLLQRACNGTKSTWNESVLTLGLEGRRKQETTHCSSR